MTTPSSYCPQCGAPIPEGAAGGLCPRCVFAKALAPTAEGTGVQAQAPPSLEAVRGAFPQWEIVGLVGSGGMGAVFKARQPQLDRFVALKILPVELACRPGFSERFQREAQALARLSHPHIVAVHDFGQAGGFYYLVMEFVDGVNLRQLLRSKKLSPKEALSIVPPVCDALQCAHDHGIVHRDIKPENLLIDKDGVVKIADFGVAKIVGASVEQKTDLAGVSTAGAVSLALGTPDYAAPEQRVGNGEVDHRADIYSLGVVLYEMLTGERPKEKLEAPSKRVQVDIRIDEIVLRALEREPGLRYQTAAEMRTGVQGVASVAAATVRAVAAQGTEQTLATQASGSRFSRLAIWGTIWAGFGPLAAVLWSPFGASLFADLHREFGKEAPNFLLAYPVTILGITSPFGATLLGWIAVAQIRRSAGRLHGMGLAVFAGLCFPLLALCGALAGFWYWVYRVALFPESSQAWALAHPGQMTNISELEWFVFKHCKALILFSTLITTTAAWFFIIRAVWRAVNRTVGAAAAANAHVVSPALPAPVNGRPHTPLATAAWCAAWASGFFAVATWSSMPHPPDFFPWGILVAAVAAVVLALPVRYSPRGRRALWFGCIQIAVWIALWLLFSSVATLRNSRQTPYAGAEVERVEVAAERATVWAHGSNDAGMIFLFGAAGERWTPRGVFLEAMFDVSLASDWLERGVHWIVKTRRGTFMTYQLEGTPGPMIGKVVFHPGTPAAEADGSYVIGEFQPENGKPLPIAVRLDRSSDKADVSTGMATSAGPVERSRIPKSVVITRNAGTVLVKHDDVDVDYVFFATKAVGASDSSSYNTHSLAWLDKGSFHLTPQMSFGYLRESADPTHLSVNGKEYDLRQGRIFLPHEDGTLEQRHIAVPLGTALDPAAMAQLLSANPTPGLSAPAPATPSNTPTSALPAKPIVPAVGPDLAKPNFGPELTREVVDEGVIDFATGVARKLPEFPPPDGNTPNWGAITESVAMLATWMEQQHLDAYFSSDQHLAAFGMKVKVLAHADWDTMTAAQLAAKFPPSKTTSPIVQPTNLYGPIKLYPRVTPSPDTPPYPRVLLYPSPNNEDTYAFETREGSLGIVQILGPSNDGVKLRYKLLKGMADGKGTP